MTAPAGAAPYPPPEEEGELQDKKIANTNIKEYIIVRGRDLKDNGDGEEENEDDKDDASKPRTLIKMPGKDMLNFDGGPSKNSARYRQDQKIVFYFGRSNNG